VSKHRPYGHVKMRGKLTLRLRCGCCVAYNKRGTINARLAKRAMLHADSIPADQP